MGAFSFPLHCSNCSYGLLGYAEPNRERKTTIRNGLSSGCFRIGACGDYLDAQSTKKSVLFLNCGQLAQTVASPTAPIKHYVRPGIVDISRKRQLLTARQRNLYLREFIAGHQDILWYACLIRVAQFAGLTTMFTSRPGT